MSEISFREAIRRVHPDTNKDVVDAGDKVRTIMMFKNEPSKMFLCLKKWGLLPDQSNSEQKPFRTRMERVYITGLRPNHFYNGSVTVLHKSKSGLFRVLKTTGKRVYFTADTIYNMGSKYCDIGSIVGAFYEKEVPY